MAKVIIEVPDKSRHKSWMKELTSVDASKTNGYAFDGTFLKRGIKAEVKVGALLLQYDEYGSVKHKEAEVLVYRVEADGDCTELLKATGRSWALDLRDDVAKLMKLQVPAGDDAKTAKLVELVARKAELEKELDFVNEQITLLAEIK